MLAVPDPLRHGFLRPGAVSVDFLSPGIYTLSSMQKRSYDHMKQISTENAPIAIGPYCQAFAHNGLVFTSGQIPLDPATGAIVGSTIEEQAHRVCQNLAAVLTEAGSDLTKVLKTTCFLASMDDFAGFNAVYAQYFTGKPARSCVAVKTLPKNVLVEVECIAVAK